MGGGRVWKAHPRRHAKTCARPWQMPHQPRRDKLVERGGIMENQKNQQNNDPQPGEIARRDLVGLSVAAGLAATSGSAEAAGMEVVETDVEIKTPDGTCDAAFIHPKSGSHAGVLIWPDAFGLRPSMREIGERVAAQG